MKYKILCFYCKIWIGMGFNPSFRMSLILGFSQIIVILAKAILKQILIFPPDKSGGNSNWGIIKNIVLDKSGGNLKDEI